MSTKSIDIYKSKNTTASSTIFTKPNKIQGTSGKDFYDEDQLAANKLVGKMGDPAGALIPNLHQAGIFNTNADKYNGHIDVFTRTYRYGLLNPAEAIGTAREFLFFTKPNLNIIKQNEDADGVEKGAPLYYDEDKGTNLGDMSFWVDLVSRKADVIAQLESCYSSTCNPVYKKDKFNHLLQNAVMNNLDVPGLSAESVDTPVNTWGVGYSYRLSSEASDDNPEFSLEFRDTRWLDVYYFFKAYDEYETLKKHGIIRPSIKYIKNKVLHDQFSIYKFMVAEDMETILYYGKMYGVYPKSLPRDVFSNATFDQGLSYSIDFRAAFYEDMNPDILADFNVLSKPLYNDMPYQMKPYNTAIGKADNRPARAAYVVMEHENRKDSHSPYVYKLRWRGDVKY